MSSLYSMMYHTGKHIIRWSPPFCELHSSVIYTMERSLVVIRIQSAIRQYPHGHGPYSRHIHLTCKNRIWDDLYRYIQLVQSQTKINLGRTRCEGLGFHCISIMRQHAPNHFQEASPQKVNVQPHRVDGEVN